MSKVGGGDDGYINQEEIHRQRLLRRRLRDRRRAAKERSEALKAISEKFIRPIAEGLDCTWEQAIEFFFRAKYRTVDFCKAIEDFEFDYVEVRANGPEITTAAKKGDAFIIREDDATQNNNEVEFKKQHFILDQLQLRRLRRKLRVVLYC